MEKGYHASLFYITAAFHHPPCAVILKTQQSTFDNSATHGGIFTNLTTNILRAFLIVLPPLPEQRAIAEALSDVDALIAALDARIAKQRAVKTATMQRLLTGEQRLPGFTGEWEERKLGDLIDLIPSGIYGSEYYIDGRVGLPVATTAHIDDDDTWNGKNMSIRFFTTEQVGKYLPVYGDLIVVKSSGSAERIQSGKIGFVGIKEVGTFVFSNFLMLLRPRMVAPKFLYYFLTSSKVKRRLPSLVEASTYPNIRIDEYLDLDVPIPPEKEQLHIEAVLSDMDAAIGALEAQRAKTVHIKQAMMQELLTGRTRLA